MIDHLISGYYFENGELPLQGIGYLRQHVTEPAYDVTTNSISAPVYEVLFEQDEDASGQPLMRYLSRALDVSEEEAFSAYRQFVMQMQQAAEKDGGYHLHGLGSFTMKDKLIFTPEPIDYLQQQPVVANRVMGASQATKPVVEQPLEIANEIAATTAAANYESPFESSQPPANRWWIGALLLAIAGIVLVALRLAGQW